MHWTAAGSVLTALVGVASVLRWLPRYSAQHPTARPEPVPAAETQLAEVS
jgi:hypothetical protein